MNCPYCLQRTNDIGSEICECPHCIGYPRFSDWNLVLRHYENDIRANLAPFITKFDFSVNFYLEEVSICYNVTFFPNSNNVEIEIYNKRNMLKLEKKISFPNASLITPDNIKIIVDRLINLKAFF